MKNKGNEKIIYFIYSKKNINENNNLYSCIAISFIENQIKNYKITFEVAENENTLKNKWPWMFRKKDNEIHIWADQVDENTFNLLNKHLEIFQKLTEEELNKKMQTIDIPSFIFTTSNDIYFYLKNKNNGEEPTPIQLEMFKSWILLKISLFFEEHPEKTFEFPLYKEYVNKNPNILANNPEYSVETFLMEISESITNAEDVLNNQKT